MDSIREKYPHFKTREWEATIPAFNSHGEAVAWFKNNFGKDFEFAGTDIINGEKCYIYHLIGTVCNLSFLNKVVVQLNEPKCKSPSRKKPPESGGEMGV